MGSFQRKNLGVENIGNLKARWWIRYAKDRRTSKGRAKTRLIRPPINTATPPLSFHPHQYRNAACSSLDSLINSADLTLHGMLRLSPTPGLRESEARMAFAHANLLGSDPWYIRSLSRGGRGSSGQKQERSALVRAPFSSFASPKAAPQPNPRSSHHPYLSPPLRPQKRTGNTTVSHAHLMGLPEYTQVHERRVVVAASKLETILADKARPQ
ncbi:hypothetical protein B0H13DRAFT_1928985 [Mycena leptocephala]|nr:hypothetical protein B0H13DRAFT_1928985 [Mycena leptocephala]